MMSKFLVNQKRCNLTIRQSFTSTNIKILDSIFDYFHLFCIILIVLLHFNMNIEHFHVNEIFDYNGQGLWIDELFPAVTSLFGYLEPVEHLEEDDEDYDDFLIVKISSFLKEDPTELVTFAIKILKCS